MKNNIDLLLVEDQPDEREMMERKVERYGLSVIAFDSGLKALEYLKELHENDLPRAYLVDMRTGGSDETEELASPLEIFKFLKEKNSTDNFRFHTGHFSEHDKEVQGLTDAKVILKADDDLDIFLKELKKSKEIS